MSKVPAVLSISFRPFFILVAMIAVINPLIWTLHYVGYFQFKLIKVTPLFWHGHEMIFGFSGAMIAGFILTASANWTNSEPYKGLALFGLVLVWTLERLSYFMPLSDVALFVISNLFLPVLTIMLLIKLLNFSKHKYIFIPILFALTLGKMLNSWGYLFENSSLELFGRELAVGTIRFIVLLIAGRVIPFFTTKKIGCNVSVPPFLNIASLLSVALLIIPWEHMFGRFFAIPLLVVAVFSNIFRQIKWRPEKTVRVPILFILHIGIAFINLSLIFELLKTFYPELNVSQASLHLLMAAGLGTLGIGIMSRVSLGHTGRVINADRWICSSYILIILGGLLRVLGLFVFPNMYLHSLLISALLWGGGFLFFLLKFWVILTTPRPDGQ